MSGGGVVGERGVELSADQYTSHPQYQPQPSGNNTPRPQDLSGGGVRAGEGCKGGTTAAWAEVSVVSAEESGEAGCKDENSRRLNNNNNNNNSNSSNSNNNNNNSCNDDDDVKLSRKSAGSTGVRAESSFDGKLIDDIVCVKKKKPSMASIRRPRHVFTSTQQAFLEKVFALNNYPSGIAKKVFASRLKLTQDIVQVWFQNRRSLQKRKRRDNISPSALAELERVFANSQYPGENIMKWLARKTDLSMVIIAEWFADRRGKWKRMESEELCKMVKTLATHQVMEQYREEISRRHLEWAKNVLMMARQSVQKAKIQTVRPAYLQSILSPSSPTQSLTLL